MADENVDDASPSPEEQAALARDALARGELRHAAHHLASALACDPGNPDWCELFDKVVANADDPLEEVVPFEPAGTPTYFGTVALRARVLAGLGRTGEALELAFGAMATKPEADYLPWALDWVARDAAAGPLGPNAAGTFLRWVKATARESLERAGPLVEQLRAARPDEAAAHAMAAILFRHVSRLDEALDCARRAQELAPDWGNAVGLALVHRTRGEVDEAVATYRRAAALDPGDVSALLDAGDLLLEARRPEESIRAYEEVLAKEPGHDWATPSIAFARFLASGGDEAHARALEDYAKANPENARARGLLRTLESPPDPYEDELPERSDATVGVLGQALEQLTGDEFDIEVRTSYPEAPSLSLVAPFLRERYRVVSIALSADRVPEPDPRKPVGRVAHELWRFEGEVPRPAVLVPRSEAAAVVAAMAERSYDRDVWWEAAGRLEVELEDLLGVMVHPPARRGELAIWDWIFRVQVAAAFAIARRHGLEVLSSLVRGPADWTVEAAILAATELAMRDEGQREAVIHLLLTRLEATPREGATGYLFGLLVNLLRIPDAPEEVRQLARDLLGQLIGDAEGEGAV